MQSALNILIVVSQRIILASKITKSKTMTCYPGEIIFGNSQESFVRRSTGEVTTYWGRLKRHVPCPD